jgi:hypothetical protein
MTTVRLYSLLLLTLLATFATQAPLHAQAPADDDGATYSLALNQDNFFGFYPSFTASVKVTDRVSWTGYGIFWTTPSFGTGGGGGLWTEAGGGLNISALDGKLGINPQVGFLHGKLLSAGDFAMAFEGIVPNLTVNLATPRVEGQLYAGFYTAMRTGQVRNSAGTGLVNTGVKNNFTHWWINSGVKLTPVASIGGHYEQLDYRPSGPDSARVGSSGLYKWAGPYVQANMSSRFSVRLLAGANVMDRPATDGNGSFYKLTATYTFP